MTYMDKLSLCAMELATYIQLRSSDETEIYECTPQRRKRMCFAKQNHVKPS
jgi:hypothetical protein